MGDSLRSITQAFKSFVEVVTTDGRKSALTATILKLADDIEELLGARIDLEARDPELTT